jgi:hypothetical protein
MYLQFRHLYHLEKLNNIYIRINNYFHSLSSVENIPLADNIEITLTIHIKLY